MYTMALLVPDVPLSRLTSQLRRRVQGKRINLPTEESK